MIRLPVVSCWPHSPPPPSQDAHLLQQRAGFAHKEMQQAERDIERAEAEAKEHAAQAAQLRQQAEKMIKQSEAAKARANDARARATEARKRWKQTPMRSRNSGRLRRKSHEPDEPAWTFHTSTLIMQRAGRSVRSARRPGNQAIEENDMDIPRLNGIIAGLEQAGTCASPSRRANPLTHRSQPPSLMTHRVRNGARSLRHPSLARLPAISS